MSSQPGAGPPSPSPVGGEASTKKKKSRSKKEKKQKIEISLWINSTKYEYGVKCTFCTKIAAVCHCPECTDFYCSSCDATAHATKKRKDHKRSTLSKLDLAHAAGLVTRAVRRYGHVLLIQRRCRELFKRFFDRTTLNYYYYNPIYNTTSWRKPYCLRKLEFAPYMSPPYAASKCQNLYYLWRAREKVRQQIAIQYRKIFDRRGGNFYYAYNGPSKLLPKANWAKPKFLGKRSFPKDILPIYTRDVACIIIQRKWRGILMRQFLRALVRATHDEVWDPVRGRFNYYHREAETLHQEKPRLLGKEPWDPNRVHDWDVDRVSLFLRRIGLKQYVTIFKNYNVDGKALILLDEEDYENLYVTNRVHIRKIQVEVTRIYKPSGPALHMSTDHAARREKIRRQKMYHAAAVMAQKHFRMFSAKCRVAVLREVRRIQEEEERTRKRILNSNLWYTDNEDLPVRKTEVALGWVEKEGLKLPPIKNFGRNRDYLSHQGWGRKGNGLKKDWLPAQAAVLDKKFEGDSHFSKVYIDKLHINGYDEKRMHLFKLNQPALQSL